MILVILTHKSAQKICNNSFITSMNIWILNFFLNLIS